MGKRKITPQVAKEWLNNYNENNYRPYSESVAEGFADDMREGRWNYIAGQTIKFNTNDDLIDGQHRLGGVVLADVAIDFNVETGYAPGDEMFIDQNRPRTIGNMLGHKGYKDPNNAAAAIRLSVDVDNWRSGKVLPRNMITKQKVVSMADNDPKLPFAVESCWTVPTRLLTRSVAVYCYRIFHEIDADDCAVFFHKLVNIEDLESGTDDAIAALNKRLLFGMWTAKGRPLRLQKVATVISAWNAWRNGESRTQMKLATTRSSGKLILPEPV